MTSEREGFPWLMRTLGSEKYWFYNILNQREEEEEVRIACDHIRKSCNEWLVVSENACHGVTNLLNLTSKETFELPQLSCNSGTFLITAPPTASNCIVALFSPERMSVLVWGPGQQSWVKIRYGSQIKLSNMMVCNQKIYCVVDKKYFGRCDVVDDALAITMLGPRPEYIGAIDEALYGQVKRIVDDGVEAEDEDEEMPNCEFLVGCGDDMFWIHLLTPFNNCVVTEHIDVYKFDNKSARWNMVHNIGENVVFFLNGPHSFSYPTTNQCTNKNCIYFLVVGGKLCVYNVEKDTVDTCFLLHHNQRLI